MVDNGRLFLACQSVQKTKQPKSIGLFLISLSDDLLADFVTPWPRFNVAKAGSMGR